MLGNHPLGRVAHLWRYPVKGLAAEPLARAEIVASGFAGDRDAALFVTTPNVARSGKPYRGKEHSRLHTVATEAAAIDLAADRAIAVERRSGGPYFDLDPVSILFDTWLADLEAMLDLRLDPLRFRPNIFARADAAFGAPEAELVGRIVRIGGARFAITQPIERCVTPTYDVATGASEPRVLTTLVRDRKNEMGVYATVVTPGEIAPGDALELEPD